MTHMASSYFYNKVARLEWNPTSNSNDAAASMIQAALQSVPGCNTLLLDHVGFCCFARTVREAWMLAHCFERCCEIQLRVLSATAGNGGGTGSTGAAYKLPTAPPVMEASAATTTTNPLPKSSAAPGASEWDALCKEFNFDNQN